MHAAHARSRGVVCNFCGKPIQLSSWFIKREISNIKEYTTIADLPSQVFPVKCRGCRVEGIYSLGQIVEFQESQGQVIELVALPPGEASKDDVEN